MTTPSLNIISLNGWSIFFDDPHTLPPGIFPVAIDRIISLPADIDGSKGHNRAQNAQIAAFNDLEAIRIWLNEYRDSPDTLRAYTKEAERLLLWAGIEQQKSISSLTADDFQYYFDFLADPPTHWINPGRISRQDNNWRPLRAPLTDASIRQARIILKALFAWLVSARYLAGNPIALSKRRRKSQAKKPTRFLPHNVWVFMLEWLDALPEQSLNEQRIKARGKHLFVLLYITAARLSEVTGARMGDMAQDSRGNWWWEVTGKGLKDGLIPMTQEVMESIKNYRLFYGLPPLPSPKEQTPLVMRLNGLSVGTRLMSDNMVYRVVKDLFYQAASAAEQQARPDIAARLRDATTHWLRHTSITHQADAGMDLRSIRENARHGSLATTSIYLGQDDKTRHQETSDKHKLRALDDTD